MGDKSKIEWTDATWPIVQGCDPISQGCAHCYAVPLLWRMMHHPDPKISRPLQGVTEQHVNAAGETILRFTGKLALREDRLTWPLKWKTPRMIFVPSHGDLFHKDVPDEFIDKVFAVMALCPQHTFQVLTKRAERMRAYMTADWRQIDIGYQVGALANAKAVTWAAASDAGESVDDKWPLPNVWLGVSVEDQDNANERIPHLLQTPAAIRFLSCEPQLGPIDLHEVIPDPLIYNAVHGMERLLDWVIVGGESGSNARPMHPDWARSLRDQCEAAGVAFFFKQWGNWREHVDADEYDTGEGRKGAPPAFIVSNDGTVHCFRGPHIKDGAVMLAVGKKAAGRLLDGREHNGFPKVAA